MSNKDINAEKIKKAVEYFKGLSSEKKAYVAANVLVKDEKMVPLVYAIMAGVAKEDKKSVISGLINAGIPNVYAAILVEQVITKRPTTQYHLKLIANLSEDKLSKLKTIFENLWIDGHDIKKISTDHNISIEDCSAILAVIVEMMSEIIRHKKSMDYYVELFHTAKLSDAGIRSMQDIIISHREKWKDMLIFSNTQDNYFQLKKMDDKINLMLQLIKEMGKTIKKSSNPDTQSYYQ